MKPDYGAFLHAQGIGSGVELVFYDVPISHISLTDVPCLTTMVNKVENGVEYAVSFDFTDEAAAHLLARCPKSIMAALTRATQSRKASGRTITLERPISLTLEARLGELQQSATDQFAPLLVQRVA